MKTRGSTTEVPSEQEMIHQRVEMWKIAGPELEKLKRRELRKLADERAICSGWESFERQ